MKRRWFIYSVLLFVLAVTVSSCDLFDDDSQIPQTKNNYLISYTQVASYPAQLVKVYLEKVGQTIPQASGLSQLVEYGFWVYKVNYKTKYKNEDIVASGIVCVPMSNGSFPLLSFQNGTNTLQSKAPSVNPTDTLFTLIEAVSSMGFVVVLPDYLGFGASKDMVHPYLEKASTVSCITDMYRAVREMASPDYLNFTLLKEVYLMGYSQGGWATLALAQELETKLSAEFTLKAASCGAGPYDLNFVARSVLSQQTYPQPYFMAYILNSYIQTGLIKNSFEEILNSPFSASGYIPALFDGTKDPAAINSKLTTQVNDLFTQDFRAGFETGDKYSSLREAFTKNSVAPWRTAKPLLLVHGQADNLITPLVSANIYGQFIALGVSPALVKLMPLPGLDHNGGVITWGLMSLDLMFENRK